jgi:hypothetical protein
LEKTLDQKNRVQSKTRLVEQINIYLHSGDYSRALDLLRGTAAEFPNDAELSKLDDMAQSGLQRNAEAQRLITESQELFAGQKPAEAIQLLRQAYELDKSNSLARAILANALVEHAHSVVETDWLEAENLTNQALKLNPAHPTAKTIRSLIVDQKKASSVEDWVARAQTLQTSGDLFAAVAWVAEGLAVHADEPRLLQIHDAIQRDQAARRRQARRGDVEELRRMELEIDKAEDAAAKQALAGRIQGTAAKYWTDGEILAIANRLLHRLGFVPQEGSSAAPAVKGAAVIFHVPRPSAQEASRIDSSQVVPSQNAPSAVSPSPAMPSPVTPSPAAPRKVAAAVSAGALPPSKVSPSEVRPRKAPPNIAPVSLVVTTPPQPPTPEQVAYAPASEASATVPKITTPPSQQRQSARSKSATPIFVIAGVVITVVATFFFTRKHYAGPVANTPLAAPALAAPTMTPAQTSAAQATPTQPVAAQTIPEPSSPVAIVSSGSTARKITPDDHPATESGSNFGMLVVVAGQDDASVFLNGKLQRQRTRGGQLRLPNLELKDYVVQVSKNGFQDPPQQEIRIRNGEPATVVFNLQPQNLQTQNLQPQPRLASLTIQGGVPEATVLVDENPFGTVHADGTLAVSGINPGDHTVELRKDGFKPRQFKEHFAEGGTVSLVVASAALEAAAGELKITFTPADATVAIAKGELLKIVGNGIPLNLAPGTYTLTARTAQRFTRSSTIEVEAGQSKTLDLSLAPSGMSKWDDPGAWKHEGESFTRKGGDFVLYGDVHTSGTFGFSAMLIKGKLLQWVLNFSDPKNYVLFQMDDDNFYRTVIRNGEKTDQIIVPDKGDKKSFRTLQVRVSSGEIVHQIKHGDHWTVLDRWTQPGVNLGEGKFGFYIPGSDQVALSSFAYYADLNVR